MISYYYKEKMLRIIFNRRNYEGVENWELVEKRNKGRTHITKQNAYAPWLNPTSKQPIILFICFLYND